MTIDKQKLATAAFAAAGVLFLVTAVIPVLKGQSLEALFVSVGILCIILSIVFGRKPGGRAT